MLKIIKLILFLYNWINQVFLITTLNIKLNLQIFVLKFNRLKLLIIVNYITLIFIFKHL